VNLQMDDSKNLRIVLPMVPGSFHCRTIKMQSEDPVAQDLSLGDDCESTIILTLPTLS